MGANFTFATCPQCDLDAETHPERVQAIQTLLAAISDADLTNIQENAGFPAAGTTDPRAAWLEACLDSCQADDREVSTIRFPGMDWAAVITGGMTWGDPPTDCFHAMQAISWIGDLFDLLIQFAKEDFKNEA